MKRLKIILQSKLFLGISLLFIVFYVFLVTRVIKYHSLYSNETIISGIVLDYNIDGDKLSLLIKAKEKVQTTYYLKNLEEKNQISEKIKLGIEVKLHGNFSEPLNNTIPNTFNYKKYLYNKKIYKTFQIDNIEMAGNKISLLYNIKNIFVKRVNNFTNINSYMRTFVLGDKDYINNDVYETYKNNGVTHLFAVSGMHVSFLVLAIQRFLKKVKLKEKYINIGISIFLIFYMFLIGFSASVVRASLLFILMLVNKKLNLNISNIRVLYILLLILLLINPFYVYDLGFQYSFLTSFGLILFHNKIKGNYIISLFLVSLVATLFSLPVTLINFYEFNLMTILNNIIIVPIVSIILFPLTIITFVIPFLEPILVFGFKVLELVSLICNNFALYVIVPKINVIFIILYYLNIYLIYKYGFKYIINIILIIIIYKLLPFIDVKSYIYYLDVGQGDSSLIITPHMRDIIMIDTGGTIEFSKEAWQERNNTFNLADNIISFLKSMGISKIDLLIITHGDIDHIGYAPDILKSIKIKSIMVNNNYINKEETILLKKINKQIVDKYQSSYIDIKNINQSKVKDENGSSLVLNVNINKQRFIFMGDAPKEIEKELIKKYELSTDILKIGHHGSNTSSDKSFLASLNPKYAIISAGRNNRYNHPSKETINNLNSLKINYFTTQEQGTIKVMLKNNIKKFKFYPP